MFYRGEKKSEPSKKITPLKDLEPILSYQELVHDKKRQELLKHIKKSLDFQKDDTKKLVQPLLENVADFLQNLPETSLYYSHRGGLLDRALNRTEAALSLMQQLLVYNDQGGVSDEQKLWLYAVFSAGLLQGIGKLYSEYSVTLYDKNGQAVGPWELLRHNMRLIGKHYSYEFTRNINEAGGTYITLFLAHRLMPSEGLAKLAAHPHVFYAWLALLAEDRDGAGSLDAILDRANAIATQRYLLLYLEDHKHLFDYGAGRIGAFLDIPHETTLERERILGAEFLLWLRDGLAEGKFLLNQPPMQAEILPTGVVFSAEIFDMFMQEHRKFKNKLIVQRAFWAWTQHNTEEIMHTEDRISLDNALLPESLKVYSAKQKQITTVRTLDLLHDTEAYTSDSRRMPNVLPPLNETGQWGFPAEKAPVLDIKTSG